MQYISLIYLLAFLPSLLLIYVLLPQCHRWKLLLAASYLFFYLLSGKLIVYLLLSTVSIHHIGLWLSKCDVDVSEKENTIEDIRAQKAAGLKKKRRILWYGVAVHIGILLFLKYFNFFGNNINVLSAKLLMPVQIPKITLVLPIGISFFTMQAISYIVDVYQKKIKADDNLGRLALYMAFFPAIMEGPICRHSQTAQSLYAGRNLEYKNVTFGIQRIIWGVFKKIVIADRLSPLVTMIFNNYSEYGGLLIVLGAVCYTLQLYADFSGCIDVTLGTAQMFGITLPENFRQPFFSRTASEFWRRWHISLGTWFKDYVFYPLSLTKFMKTLGKNARKKYGRYIGPIIQSSIPLFAVWLCNGLWHGTGWHYIFFGLYYFTIILLENLIEPFAAKMAVALHLNRDRLIWRMIQAIKMAAIIVTGELFFRAVRLRAGFSMFRSIFTGFDAAVFTNGSILKLGLSGKDFFAVIAGLILVFIVGVLHEKGVSIRERVSGWNICLRWSFYYAAILAVIIFGAYGNGYIPADPLYAGF